VKCWRRKVGTMQASRGPDRAVSLPLTHLTSHSSMRLYAVCDRHRRCYEAVVGTRLPLLMIEFSFYPVPVPLFLPISSATEPLEWKYGTLPSRGSRYMPHQGHQGHQFLVIDIFHGWFLPAYRMSSKVIGAHDPHIAKTFHQTH